MNEGDDKFRFYEEGSINHNKNSQESNWIIVKNKDSSDVIPKELIPNFTEIKKNSFDFVMTGKCHFTRYLKDRTPLNEVFINENTLFQWRFYVAVDLLNFYKVLFTKVENYDEETEYFAHWINEDIGVQRYRRKVVYFANDTISGYKTKLAIHFENDVESANFVNFFKKSIKNDKILSKRNGNYR